MGERRMFAKTIVLSDAFLDMPMSARCLYFTLGMMADDDGFVNSPRSIMRQCGSSDDDMKLLIAKRFVIIFESGVIVIKHWRLHNYIQKDRYKPTQYVEEKSKLIEKENGVYSLDTKCIQNVSKVDTQVKLSKDKLSKDNNKKFQKPTLSEVKAYCDERQNSVDPAQFYDYYESNGWMVGKSHMKDWKACVRRWERTDLPGMKKDVLPVYPESSEESKTAEDIASLLKDL